MVPRVRQQAKNDFALLGGLVRKGGSEALVQRMRSTYSKGEMTDPRVQAAEERENRRQSQAARTVGRSKRVLGLIGNYPDERDLSEHEREHEVANPTMLAPRGMGRN